MTRARGAIVALALAAAACRAVEAPRWDPTLPSEASSALVRAADLVREGSPRLAHAVLSEAVAAAPTDADLWFALQDGEERLLRAGVTPPGYAEADGAAPNVRLRRHWRARASASGEPLTYVLAARAEDDALAALYLLDEALARAPGHALAHYGRAHVLFGLGRLEEASAALERAFAAEPGAIAARRLETRLLAAFGRERTAVQALETWLAHTDGDPRVRDVERRDAELDLVALELGLGESARALRRIEERVDPLLPATGPVAARAEMLRCIALESAGRHREAYDAAQRAASLDPADPIALMHRALLEQHRLRDPGLARETWLAVIDRILAREGAFDPSLALLLLRARVEVANLERGPPAGLERRR